MTCMLPDDPGQEVRGSVRPELLTGALPDLLHPPPPLDPLLSGDRNTSSPVKELCKLGPSLPPSPHSHPHSAARQRRVVGSEVAVG